MKDYVNSAALQEYTTKLIAKLKTLFPGTPTAAATVADMTDHSKTYVYVGTESGYTAGDWYYWNGTAWTSGGPFQATSIITDTTLAVAGEAADAKATGDAIAAAKTAVLNAMAPAYSTSATYAVGDYVNYNGAIYRCTTAITTAEAWTAGHWAAVTMGADLEGQVSDLKTHIGDQSLKMVSVTQESGSFSTDVGSEITFSDSNNYVRASFVPTPGKQYDITYTNRNISSAVSGYIVTVDGNNVVIANYESVAKNTESTEKTVRMSFSASEKTVWIRSKSLTTIRVVEVLSVSDAEQENADNIGSELHATRKTVYYPFKIISGHTYEIRNNCTNGIRIDARIGSSGDYDERSVQINGMETGTYTFSINANWVAIYAPNDSVIDVTIIDTQGLEYRVTKNSADISDKVDKVVGKGLSENDFTDVDKTALDNIKATDKTLTIGGKAADAQSTGNVIGVPLHATSESDFYSYDVIAGHSYQITNNSDITIRLRTYTAPSGTQIEQSDAVGVGRAKIFDCTTTTGTVKIYTGGHSGNIDVTVEDTQSLLYRIAQNEYVLNNGKVPSYFETELADAISKIKTNLYDTGKNGESFVFITDIHWGNNAKNSPALVFRVLAETEINTVFCGGDVIDSGERAAELQKMETVMTALQFAKHHFTFTAFGNHDSNWLDYGSQHQHPDRRFSLETVYALMGKRSESYLHWMTDRDMSFYFDNDACKTRYIVIDTGEMTSPPTGEDAWDITAFPELADVMMTTPSGWKIILAGHHVANNNFKPCRDMADAYNARGTYTNADIGVNEDFSSGQAEVVLILGGHSHIDMEELTPGLLPIVRTDCDSSRTESLIPGTETKNYEVGTITEQCFDVVTLNYSKHYISFVRVGRGGDRLIHTQPITKSVSGTETLTPTLTPVDWSTSNDSIATVSGGTVSCVGAGSCYIIATDENYNTESWIISVS